MFWFWETNCCKCEFTNELRIYREDIQIVYNHLAVKNPLYFLSYRSYIQSAVEVVSERLSCFVVHTADILFTLGIADIVPAYRYSLQRYESRYFHPIISHNLMNVIYLFRCRRLILFPTMASLLIEIIYFGAFVEQTRKDGFLTKIYVLAVTGIVILNLNSVYNFIYKPEAPYLDNGRDPLWDTQTVELADEICTDCETDAEKARAFQNWIVSNLEYDFEAAPFIQYFDVSKTIRTRKGLCFDFAHLFAAFCRSQNIPCYVIDGTSYTDPTDAHTWNRVYYDGAWWDVDITSDIMRKQSGQELYSFRMLESASASDRYFYITKIY